MIKLPDFKKAFDHENDFYLSSHPSRMGKCLAHYELFKIANALPGAIVECGVFKGVSFLRFATFQHLYGDRPRKLIGFDTFTTFPQTAFPGDKARRAAFIQDAGTASISTAQLFSVAKKKGLDVSMDLVAGDVTKTVPAYVKAHPDLKIALLNLDTDIYEPAVTVLQYLYPHIVKGGVLISDDYGIFPGETKAIDDYFKGRPVVIRNFPKLKTPRYIIKT